ncbi:carboxypeptidase regulatory-like domain-containing protein [Coleofasciculus sp. G2-EDA-02]|uniref:carboxypeptidase regulatory-like domain-containing protein n=1 Tax=Coleofasciculus sp. G2-EDA-02 TaxID=3069529 RepID=UPI004064701A
MMSWSDKATAHGAKINYETTQAIKIDAAFDNGKPMSNAQVTVYSPQDPSTPWLQGTTDENGSFVFVPERSQPGEWAVQVRQAGHGDLITISMGENQSATENTVDSQVMSIQSKSGSFTPAQIVVMAVAVIWGFVGTALYFSKGTKHAK